jgi:hypothetical protein
LARLKVCQIVNEIVFRFQRDIGKVVRRACLSRFRDAVPSHRSPDQRQETGDCCPDTPTLPTEIPYSLLSPSRRTAFQTPHFLNPFRRNCTATSTIHSIPIRFIRAIRSGNSIGPRTLQAASGPVSFPPDNAFRTDPLVGRSFSGEGFSRSTSRPDGCYVLPNSEVLARMPQSHTSRPFFSGKDQVGYGE